MEKPEQSVPVSSFLEYAARQTETTQALVLLIEALVTVWVDTLPSHVKESVSRTNLQEHIQSVHEGVAQMRTLAHKFALEGTSGKIQ